MNGRKSKVRRMRRMRAAADEVTRELLRDLEPEPEPDVQFNPKFLTVSVTAELVDLVVHDYGKEQETYETEKS